MIILHKNLALVLLITTITTPLTAWDPFSSTPSEDVIADKILETIQKKGVDKFCRKGDASKLIFSIRSFDGKAASVSQTLAALGMLACSQGNMEDFKNSKFYQNAKSKLGTDDLNAIKVIFLEKIKSAKGKTLSLSCAAVSGGLVASGVGAEAAPVVAKACQSAIK